MPYHLLLDHAGEARLGKLQIGTTRRGIGPCYADKAARLGIRVQDLLDEKILKKKIVAAMEPKRLSAAPVREGARARPAVDDRGLPRPTATGSSSTSPTPRALAWDALDARRQRALRGRPGHAARHRPRHLSVRDLVEPGRRRRLRRRRRRPEGHRRGLGHRQGLRDARRRRPVPDRARRRARRRACARPAASSAPPPAAPRRVRLARPRRAALRRAHQRARPRLAITKLDVLTGIGPLSVCTRYRGAEERDASTTSPTTSRCCTTPRGEYEELPGWDEDITELPRRVDDLPAGRARLPRLHRGLRRRADRAGRRRPRPRPGHLDRGRPRQPAPRPRPPRA